MLIDINEAREYAEELERDLMNYRDKAEKSILLSSYYQGRVKSIEEKLEKLKRIGFNSPSFNSHIYHILNEQKSK